MKTYSEILQSITDEFVYLGTPPELEQIKTFLQDKNVLLNQTEINNLQLAANKQLVGFGPLESLIREGTTDLLVNAPDSVWVDGRGGLELYENVFASSQEVEFLARRLASIANARLDDAHPFVDGKLPDGTRLHALIPPISGSCASISLRFPNRETIPIEYWLEDLNPKNQELVLAAVKGELSFMISGQTSSGKTTLLKSVLAARPKRHRTVVIEESNEIQIPNKNIVNLLARQANSEGNGEISLENLVRQSLRMRPDSIVVGEVRGREVVDFLLAISSGHAGSGTTIHAESGGVLNRVQLLALLAGLSRDFSRDLFEQSVDLVIHCSKSKFGRRIVSVLEN